MIQDGGKQLKLVGILPRGVKISVRVTADEAARIRRDRELQIAEAHRLDILLANLSYRHPRGLKFLRGRLNSAIRGGCYTRLQIHALVNKLIAQGRAQRIGKRGVVRK